MVTKAPLFLHEEVMLLALRDDRGTVTLESKYQYAIGGAILAELLLRDRVRIVKPKRKSLVELVSAKPVGDSLVDECLERIRDSRRRGTPQSWVSRFARIKRLKHRVAEQLCARRILKRDEGKVLRVFTRKIYPEIDPRPEREIVERLRKAIFKSSKNVDPRTVVLLSLAHSTRLLAMAFDKKRLRERKKRIKQVVDGEMTGKAAADVIRAMQAAVVAATAAVVVTSTSN